jgi:hypothetical protein
MPKSGGGDCEGSHRLDAALHSAAQDAYEYAYAYASRIVRRSLHQDDR